MTSIKWQAEADLSSLTRTSATDTGQGSLTAGVSLYVDGSRVRVGPTESGLNDARDFLSASTQTRLIGTLTNALAVGSGCQTGGGGPVALGGGQALLQRGLAGQVQAGGQGARKGVGKGGGQCGR